MTKQKNIIHITATQLKHRTIFVIQLDHGLDLITNSSSELFVLKGETSKMVTEMVESVYPEYTKEYGSVVSIDDLDEEQFSTYLSYAHESWSFNADIEAKISIARKFDIDPNILYSNYKEVSSESRQNGMVTETWWPQYSDDGLQMLKDKIDPNKTMHFLYSLDENPDWEKQEALSGIGTRYHLG